MAFISAPKKRKPSFKLAIVACGVAIIVLGMGVFTRLADAGLGCPDWPGCYGHLLWPNEHHEVEAANAAFPDMPVEHDKTWPEMIHRYLASSLGLFTIALLVMAVQARRLAKKPEQQPLKLPAFLLGFIILQGLFGMWTVTLKLWPQVVTAHLLGGFTTISLLWLLALRLNNKYWHLSRTMAPRLDAVKPIAVVALMVVVVQIALGGWTTSNYADIACPDFPTCQGAFLPPMDFANGFNIAQHIGPNYLGGQLDNAARVAIHISHRTGALITALVVGLLAARLYFLGAKKFQKLAKLIAVVLLVQLLLGVSNILFHFPIAVAVAHNLVGAMLLLSVVTANYYLRTARLKSPGGRR